MISVWAGLGVRQRLRWRHQETPAPQAVRESPALGAGEVHRAHTRVPQGHGGLGLDAWPGQTEDERQQGYNQEKAF